ncbi:MAG: hypothetical protein B1H09_01050 [Gemmatimonadaceae bacterium 4484_173]|nr:MAG: hypothetical protein B1H09_01050 [Gemmatimonadaceae bacterium 4484_173]
MSKVVFLVPALVMATMALASGEFSTGGSELLKFKGYLVSTFNTYGETDANPNNGFSIAASIEWLPVLNHWLDAKIAFKSLPTRYTGAIEDLSLTTEDIVLNMHFNEVATLSMGHFKRPICYNYTRSSSSMYFRDRAILTGLTGDFGKRDIGADLGLNFGFTSIDIAYTNGAGDNQPEDDSHKSFTARAVFEPMDNIQVAGAFGHYSEDADSTGTTTVAANAMDFYTVIKQPVSENVELSFTGEYMVVGEPMEDSSDWTNATGYAATLMADFDLNGSMFQAVRPAIRYENSSPGFVGDDPENDEGAFDFALNLDVYSRNNTIQAGIRNHTFQSTGEDSYTDMYFGWRMKF